MQTYTQAYILIHPTGLLHAKEDKYEIFSLIMNIFLIISFQSPDHSIGCDLSFFQGRAPSVLSNSAIRSNLLSPLTSTLI